MRQRWCSERDGRRVSVIPERPAIMAWCGNVVLISECSWRLTVWNRCPRLRGHHGGRSPRLATGGRGGDRSRTRDSIQSAAAGGCAIIAGPLGAFLRRSQGCRGYGRRWSTCLHRLPNRVPDRRRGRRSKRRPVARSGAPSGRCERLVRVRRLVHCPTRDNIAGAATPRCSSSEIDHRPRVHDAQAGALAKSCSTHRTRLGANVHGPRILPGRL
jgi:hypothetical protein